MDINELQITQANTPEWNIIYLILKYAIKDLDCAIFVIVPVAGRLLKCHKVSNRIIIGHFALPVATFNQGLCPKKRKKGIA